MIIQKLQLGVLFPQNLNAGHGAVVASLLPAALFAFRAVAVDGALGNHHLPGDQVADAVLPVRPFHLRARVSWNVSFLQTRQGSIAVNTHQLSVDSFDAASVSVFGHSLGTKTFITAFVESATSFVHGCRHSGGLFRAHRKFVVWVSQIAIGAVFESMLENLSLNVFPNSAVNRVVVSDAHRHLAPLFLLPQRRRGEDKSANDKNEEHGRLGRLGRFDRSALSPWSV